MKIDISVKLLPLVLLFATAISTLATAQEAGVLGYWKEPGGGVIHVERCGNDVCATLVGLGPAAPGRLDVHNPDVSKRQRSLCGLRIGEGFQLRSAIKAADGTLYDPKSGKTYHGVMTSHGDQLDLRGYMGISLFGRTERWIRSGLVPACKS